MKARLGVVVVLVAMAVGLIGLQALSAQAPAATSEAEIKLAAPRTSGGMSLTEALAKRRTVRTFSKQPVSMEDVAQLCWAAQGITQEARGLRTAPSALAQYPATVFVVDHKGVYEYQPKPHALHRIAEGDMLKKLHEVEGQPALGSAAVCLIVAMDVEHMKARAKDRAERYSLLEGGHIAQNVLLQATALGLAGVPMGGLGEEETVAAMSLPKQLRPVYLLPIGHP
jgi:SagB-type dehydrogenase family enzyme